MSPPISYLPNQTKQKILVRLKNGVSYEGRLLLHDNSMNLFLEDCVETDQTGKTTRLGNALLRGNNILFIKLEV